MNKVHAVVASVVVEEAGRNYGIRQRIGVVVRAGVALGAAVMVCGAPSMVYASVPERVMVDDGLDMQIGEHAIVDLGPNFGAQSQYEAYIAALSPAKPAVVASYAVPVMVDKDERAFLYHSPNMPDLSEGMNRESSAAGNVNSEMAIANIAPSSAAVSNAYSLGNSAASIPVAPEIGVVGPEDFSEGYDWSVDPQALAAASIPNAPEIGVVGPEDFSEGYDWSVAPQALAAASIPNAPEIGVVGPEDFSEGYDWYVDPVLSGREFDPVERAANGGGENDSNVAPHALNVASMPPVESVQHSVFPSISPEAQLQHLYENGSISKEVLEAEIGAYEIVVPQPVQGPEMENESYSIPSRYGYVQYYK